MNIEELNETQIEFDYHLEDYMERHPHYVSPGAKKNWNKIKFGYLILAIGTIIGIWAFTNRADKNLRHDINQLGIASCISSIKTYNKFNDQIDTQIETQRESLSINSSRGDKERADINKSAIHRLKNDKIIPPTPEICKSKLLLR